MEELKMKKQLLDNTKLVPALVPSVTAIQESSPYGVTVDRLNFMSAIANVSVGAASGTPSAQSVKAVIYHGDLSNGSDKVKFQPDGVDVETSALTTDSSNTSVQIDLAGAKRYITVQFVVDFTGGTTPAIPVVGTIALGDPSYTEDIV